MAANDKVVELIKAALKKSHEDEEKFVKEELTRLQSEYSRNQTKLHKVYEDKLEGVINEEFFRTKYDEIQQRQIEVHSEIERLRKRNSKYFEEGVEIFELMKNIKNQYVKSNPAQKQRIMKILVSNCELKDKNAIIYWNRPFDILFEMGQTQKWGGRRNSRGPGSPPPWQRRRNALYCFPGTPRGEKRST